MSGSLVLAGWELRSAVRSRWVLAMSVVFAGACVAVTLFGLRTLRELGLAGGSAASDALLNLSIVLPPLLGLLIGAGSVAGARDRGTLAMFTAQPITPATMLAGWFLGLTASTWITVAVGYGAAGVAIGAVATGSDLAAFASVFLVTLGISAVSVSLGLAVSSWASTRMHAIAVVVALWFTLAIGMDMVLVVVVPGLRLGPDALLATVLLNPLEASRVLGGLLLDPDGLALGPFGSHVLERFGTLGSKALLAGSLVAWTAIGLGISHRALRRRDV